MHLTRLGKLILILLALCGTLSGAAVTAARQGQDPFRCLTLASLGQRRALTIDTATGRSALDDRTLMLPTRGDPSLLYFPSPDGRYRAGLYGDSNQPHFTLLANEAKPLTLEDPDSWATAGSWSPDSRHFAFIWTSRVDQRRVLKVVNARSRQIAAIDLTYDQDSSLGDAALAWSPDGTSVALAYSLGYEDRTVVYRYMTETEQFRIDELTAPGSVFHVEWSPDGAHLALAVGVGPGHILMIDRKGNVLKFESPHNIQGYIDRYGVAVTAFWWLNAERLIVNTTNEAETFFEVYGVDGSKAVFLHGVQYVDYWYGNVDGGRRVILTVRGNERQAGPELLGTLIELDTETGTQRTLLENVRLEKSEGANRYRQNRYDEHRDALLFAQWTEGEQAIVMTDRAGRILYRMPITSLPGDWFVWSNDNSKALLVASGQNGLQRVILRTDGAVLHSSLVAGKSTGTLRWLADDQHLIFFGATETMGYIDLIDLSSQTSVVHRLAEGPSAEGWFRGELDGVVYFAGPNGDGYALMDGTAVTLPHLTDGPQSAWVAPDGHAALVTSHSDTRSAPITLRNHQQDKLVWNFSEALVFASWRPDSSQFVIISGPISMPANIYPRWLRVYRADGTLIREGPLSGDIPVYGHRWSDCRAPAGSEGE